MSSGGNASGRRTPLFKTVRIPHDVDAFCKQQFNLYVKFVFLFGCRH